MSENIVFIDYRVAGYESLIENPAPETAYYLLTENGNGIDQMQEILSGYSELKSIQIVSHGSVGTLSLGGSELNINNLRNHTNQLQSIGSSLIQTGDILIYGCNVAQGDEGAAFLNELANITRADVSASSDTTGHVQLNADWTLEINTGTIEASNLFDGQESTLYWNDTLDVDNIPPAVTSFNPSDGATGVALSNNITVTFNESIQRGTGMIELRSGSATGTVIEFINAATSNRLTISGAALTIDPASNLANNTQYFLILPSGTVKDLAGNNYAGTSSYDFTTPDTILPSVTSYNPSDGATGVALSNNITVTFNESIQRGTGTIELRSGSATGTVIESFNAASSNRLTISGAALTIDPASYLASNTHYFLTFASGTIKDLAGNNYAGTSTYDFTTLTDSTPPAVASFNPSDGATGVALGNNIIVSFNESIQLGTGTIELRSGSATGTVVESFNAASSNRLTISGAALTIDPTSNLANNTHYFLTFASGTIKDLAGNNYAGTSTYDFTTLTDSTPPTVTSFNPSDGATGVALGNNIIVSFNESIQR
ncbi:MAG: DUF4347 domain-containing protein, partial [Chlorobiaceae bacterium]|nr:DUF4347 domain-containing protein [Chlorobiaceae bacterium]